MCEKGRFCFSAFCGSAFDPNAGATSEGEAAGSQSNVSRHTRLAARRPLLEVLVGVVDVVDVVLHGACTLLSPLFSGDFGLNVEF